MRTSAAAARRLHCTALRPRPARLQYHLYERRQAKGSAARALSALQAAQPGAEALSLRRDVLPKLEVGGSAGGWYFLLCAARLVVLHCAAGWNAVKTLLPGASLLAHD